MKLTERLNVLIQAATMSQNSGALTLDDAVNIKTAIDTVSSGILNQNFTSAINLLIENAISSQKKGVYTLKDAYMIYIAIDGIETEFQNELNRINSGTVVTTPSPDVTSHSGENVVSIPPKKLKKNP